MPSPKQILVKGNNKTHYLVKCATCESIFICSSWDLVKHACYNSVSCPECFNFTKFKLDAKTYDINVLRKMTKEELEKEFIPAKSNISSNKETLISKIKKFFKNKER